MLNLVHDSCQVQLSPQRGAIVTSLKVNGKEALYLDQATFDDPTRNVRGGIPVLFPLCGPQAEPAVMKQHGFARNLAWDVVEQSDRRAVLQLSDREETRAVYPYQFTYSLCFTVHSSGLRIEQTIRNTGDATMPLQFGFHPYFQVGAKSELEFELPVTTYSDNKSSDAGPFQGFDFEREEVDWAFPNPTAGQASFRDCSRGMEFTVRYSPEYRELVFWTLKGKPFVCVEPWSSSRFAYPDGEGVHRIGPGESLEAWIEVEVS